VPVVSEDPKPYYPTTDYSSKEGNWPNLSITSHPEGTKGGTQRKYSTNPNYQASLNKPYYHRVLTEAEQRAFEEEAPKVIQAYTKPKEVGPALHFKLKTTGPSISTSSRRGEDGSLTTSS
jgi:hypothetical protein